MRSWLNHFTNRANTGMTDPRATAAGVVVLKQIWDIETEKEKVASKASPISSDIYTTSHNQNGIPRRRRGKRV